MSNPLRARTHLVTETGYLTADESQPRCPESTAQQQQSNLYAAATWSIVSWRIGGYGRFIQPTTNATDAETATRSTVLTNPVGIAAGKQPLLGAAETDGEILSSDRPGTVDGVSDTPSEVSGGVRVFAPGLLQPCLTRVSPKTRGAPTSCASLGAATDSEDSGCDYGTGSGYLVCNPCGGNGTMLDAAATPSEPTTSLPGADGSELGATGTATGRMPDATGTDADHPIESSAMNRTIDDLPTSTDELWRESFAELIRKTNRRTPSAGASRPESTRSPLKNDGKLVAGDPVAAPATDRGDSSSTP